MNLIRFAVASTLTSAATLMYAHPLMAADAKIDNDTTLDEVVVTAQNRVENVQNVPIAIDVVSSEKIADSGFTNLNDIQKIAPAVQLINDNSQLRVTIRGVGSNTNAGLWLLPECQLERHAVRGTARPFCRGKLARHC